MTRLGGGQSGRINFPFRLQDDNNLYAIGTTRRNVLQCKVEVVRHTTNDYDVITYDGRGEKLNRAQRNLAKSQDSLTVPGAKGYLDLAVVADGPVGDIDTVGSKVIFNYGAADFASFQLGTDFSWDTLTLGTDPTFSQSVAPNAELGSYCEVPNLTLTNGLERDGIQTITCYFPCNAP